MRKIQRHRSPPPWCRPIAAAYYTFKAAIYGDPFTLALSSRRVGADSRDEDAELRRAQAYDWISRGTDPEENDKRPLGSFGRVASRMNCRYRAPVPFTPLVATVLLASQSTGSTCDARQPRTR